MTIPDGLPRSCRYCSERCQNGTQGIKGAMDRSRIPADLCNHIVDICEEVLPCD